jgi:hypothetical protein
MRTRGKSCELGFLQDACEFHAQADELDRLGFLLEAVGLLVRGVEAAGDLVEILRRERSRGAWDGEFEILPGIAQIDRPDGAPLGARHLLTLEPFARPSGELGSDAVDASKRLASEGGERGLHEIRHQVAIEQAFGAQDARVGRNDDAGNAQLSRHLAGVQRTRAAEREQREAAGIVAALDRDGADRLHHRRRHEAHDAEGGFQALEANPFRQPIHRGRGEFGADLHAAVE